jgi:hypothetical protein
VPSTLRNDTRRAVALGRIATAWDKKPELRFGQLLVLALQADNESPIFEVTVDTIERMDDTQLAELIERYVLLGKKDGGE